VIQFSQHFSGMQPWCKMRLPVMPCLSENKLLVIDEMYSSVTSSFVTFYQGICSS